MAFNLNEIKAQCDRRHLQIFFFVCFLSSVKTVDRGLIKIACRAQFPISGGQQPVVKLPLNSLE